MIIELIVLLLVILAVVVLFRILKKIGPIIWSSIGALVLLWVLNLLGLKVAISIWTVLIVAIGGLPGLILVVILHLLGWAF
jgi:hypothetical protein